MQITVKLYLAKKMQGNRVLKLSSLVAWVDGEGFFFSFFGLNYELSYHSNPLMHKLFSIIIFFKGEM